MSFAPSGGIKKRVVERSARVTRDKNPAADGTADGDSPKLSARERASMKSDAAHEAKKVNSPRRANAPAKVAGATNSPRGGAGPATSTTTTPRGTGAANGSKTSATTATTPRATATNNTTARANGNGAPASNGPARRAKAEQVMEASPSPRGRGKVVKDENSMKLPRRQTNTHSFLKKKQSDRTLDELTQLDIVLTLKEEKLKLKEEEMARKEKEYQAEIRALKVELEQAGRSNVDSMISNPGDQHALLKAVFEEELSGNDFMENLKRFPEQTKHEWILCLSAHMLRMGKLLSLNQVVTRSMHHMAEAMAEVAADACELLDAERATVWAVDEKNYQLYSLVTAGESAKEIRIHADAGIVGHVFKTGEIVNIEDAYDDYRFNQDVDKKTGFKTKAILALPINGHSGYRMGVLQVMNKRDGSDFSDADETKAVGLTIKVGIHLYQAMCFDECNSIQRKIPLLGFIVDSFSNEIRVASTMDSLIEQICDTVDCERASLFLADPERQELWSKSAKSDKEIRFPWDKGVAALCFQTSETINIPDAYDDDRFNTNVDLATGFKTRNILCMPLMDDKGKTIGVMQAINKNDEESWFGDEDEYYFKRLAFQASQNLMYARLYEETFSK